MPDSNKDDKIVKSEDQDMPAEEQVSEPAVQDDTVSDDNNMSQTDDQTQGSEPTLDQDVAEEAAETAETGPEPEVTKPEAETKTEETPTPAEEPADQPEETDTPPSDDTPGKWYVVHTFSGHENKVATTLKQRIESEHLENKIFDILVPTQDKIEIRAGKKEAVKEKIFPGYILVKMDLDDNSWLAVRTTPGVTAFVGMNNRPTPIPAREVASIVKFMTQGAPATFKDVFLVDDTVKIIDGPFTDFIGKVDSVDKEKGKVRVLVSIFGRETPVELDFLQVTKL